MSPREAKKKPRSKRFEEHLETLEEIVRELEGGELPLEDSLQRYQLGVESLRQCQKILREVEHRVEVLVAGPGEEAEEAPETDGEPGAEPEDDDAQLF